MIPAELIDLVALMAGSLVGYAIIGVAVDSLNKSRYRAQLCRPFRASGT